MIISSLFNCYSHLLLEVSTLSTVCSNIKLSLDLQVESPQNCTETALSAWRLHRGQVYSTICPYLVCSAHRTLIHIRNGPPSCSTSSNSSGSMSDLTSPISQTTTTPSPASRLRSNSLSSLSSIDSFDSAADWVSYIHWFCTSIPVLNIFQHALVRMFVK